MRIHIRLLLLLLALFLVSCGTDYGHPPLDPNQGVSSAPSLQNSTGRPGAVSVEIVYLNHLPVFSILTQVNNILTTYGQDISITWYDFDTKEGVTFAADKQITDHTPLIIFINGSRKATVNGQEVDFNNFPGSSWKIEDLRTALDQATGK